jgi:hypothetical protein
MKWFLIVCMLMACSLFLVSCFFGPSLIFFDRDTIGKPNLVPNPDFEIPLLPDKKLPGDWMFLSTTDYRESLSWDSLTVMSGKKSMKIENPAQQLLLVSESFPIDNKSAYLNRCYVTSKNPSSAPIVLYFRTFDKIGARKDNFTSKLKANGDWQEILLSTGFFKPTAQFARVIISIPMDPENTYWIDNIGSFHVHTFSR